MSGRLEARALAVLAFAGWAVFVMVSTITLIRGSVPGTGEVFQVDWHVYWAGARDLMEGDLYRVPLDAEGRTLSAEEFSLPPLSAAWPVPLLWLPVIVGGYAWQVIGAAATAVAAGATFAIAGIPRPWLMSGLGVGALSLTILYLEGLHLATNNYLVLGLVAVGSWALLTRRDTAAGVLIGLAIATKLWPATLLIVALRERRPLVIAWAVGVILAQGLLLFAWLGFDAIGEAIDTFRTPIPPTGILIGPSAVPDLREAWQSGLAVATSLALLALPARGRAGVGVGIIAGLAVIPNLWVHYAPTLLFAAALIASDVWREVERRRGALLRDERAAPGDLPASRR